MAEALMAKDGGTKVLKVAGLDLSLTATGCVVWQGWKVVARWVIKTKPEDGTIEERARFIGLELAECFRENKVTIVGLENFAFGKPYQQAAIGRLQGVVRFTLQEQGFPIHYEVTPTELKKWVTGTGRADKALMVRAAKPYMDKPTKDEADALHVARWTYLRHTEEV